MIYFFLKVYDLLRNIIFKFIFVEEYYLKNFNITTFSKGAQRVNTENFQKPVRNRQIYEENEPKIKNSRRNLIASGKILDYKCQNKPNKTKNIF
jgi:hypothetical protein